MTGEIASFFGNLPKELITVIIAMIPIAELRGAIPWAVANPPIGGGLSWQTAYIYAVIGNLIPVFPILIFFDKAYNLLNRFKFFNRLFEWLFARTRKKGKLIERYEIIGLVLFVGIPLPVTGAWTGALAAFLFGISLKKSIPAITMGVLIAGVIVTLASLGVINILQIFVK